MDLSLEALEPRLLLNATVTDANILAQILPDAGTPGVAGIGDVILTTWDNSATGDNNPALVDGVFVDLSQLGGPASLPMVDDGTGADAVAGDNIYTNAWTVVPGAIDDTNLNVSVTAADAAGAGHDADTSNLSVDSIAPTVTDANITTVISFDSFVGGVADIGDTIRVTWNNSAGGDNAGGANSDFVGATADFSAFGGGAAVVMVDNGTGGDVFAGDGIYTATFTVVAGAVDGTNLNASVTATDDAGNQTTTADTSNLSVDSIAPTVTDANIGVALTTDGRTGGVADINDVITVTWDNSAGGDNNADTLSAVTVNLSSIGGPSAATLFDDGTNGDATASDGIYTLAYTIRAGNVSTAVRNVSISATDNAGNKTTTGDTTGLTYNNGPVATFASGPTLVSIYDVAGPIDIVPADVTVKFGAGGVVSQLKIVGSGAGTGMGIVIAGAPRIKNIKDGRSGGGLAPVAFIAANTRMENVKLRTGMSGYNLNALTLDGIAFAANIDGDGSTTDTQAIWGSSGMGKSEFRGQVNGDVWLQAGSPALNKMRIRGGGYHGGMTLWGDAGTISIEGGDFGSRIDVHGSLRRFILRERRGQGGLFRGGANLWVQGLFRSGRIQRYETADCGPFGVDVGELGGRLRLDSFSVRQNDLPFYDGDFRVVAW